MRDLKLKKYILSLVKHVLKDIPLAIFETRNEVSSPILTGFSKLNYLRHA